MFMIIYYLLGNIKMHWRIYFNTNWI